MKKGATDAEVDDLVNKLLTRQTYYSHGSVIDYEEAAALGLKIEYLAPENELWQALRLLTCMYEADTRKNQYLKVFRGKQAKFSDSKANCGTRRNPGTGSSLYPIPFASSPMLKWRLALANAKA